MEISAHTEDKNNKFHPDRLPCSESITYHHRFNNRGPYNDIDVIRAEMGQLRNWKIEDDDGFNPKARNFADFFETYKKNKGNDQERRKDFQKAIFNERLTALCLSGGGIRSASFCLGVLQALSRQNMLSDFDYISTVSGGGYIGGWLSAWASRKKYPEDTKNDERVGIEVVQEALSSNIECNEIINLRKYTNFLSPRIGFMSLDTRVLWITYLRNFFLNGLLIFPLLLAVIALIKFLAIIILYVASIDELKYSPTNFIKMKSIHIFFIAYFIGHTFLSYGMLRSKSGDLDTNELAERMRQKCKDLKLSSNFFNPSLWLSTDFLWLKSLLIRASYLFKWILFPFKCLSKKYHWLFDLDYRNFFITSCYSVLGITAAGIMTSPYLSRNITCNHSLLWSLLIIGTIFGIIWIITFSIPWFLQGYSIKEEKKVNVLPMHTTLGAIFVGGLTAGVIFCLGFYCLNGFIHGFISIDNFMDPNSTDFCSNDNFLFYENYSLAIYFGPLIPIAADFIGSAIFSASISKKPNMDELQEWSARMLALLFMLGGSWFIFSLVATPLDWSNIPLIFNTESTFNSLIDLQSEKTNYHNLITFFLVFASGIGVVIYGKSSKTSAAPNPNENKYSKFIKSLALLGGIIFLYMTMLNLSAAYDRFLFPNNELIKMIFEFPSISTKFSPLKIIPDSLIPQTHINYALSLLFISIVIFVIFTLVTSYFININSFSMHRYYRNRLIRSFLGSVHLNRNPDLFTNFDPNDNIDMFKLTHKSPLLIINTALNLLNDDNLLWQERKSSSFTISRLFCGNITVGYRPSKGINGKSGYGEDISLGTAMAISGAAVSPNMGYNSSPVITFVMTLFNARLGWWLGNPKYDSWREIGPPNAIYYYICELFGLTNDHRDYVYLSDGGHFENLGAYEMIRRCCRTIVIVDAGCDPDSKFADLGKLIRLARIDFNAEITFNRDFKLTDGETHHFAPRHLGENKCPPYCLVGEIEYRDINSRGTIIYIKPGVHGDEPLDVCSYHVQNPVFPHETTSDQFFSESQFESYRKLGLHIGSKVFKAIAI